MTYWGRPDKGVLLRKIVITMAAGLTMTACSPQYTEDRGFEVRMVVETPSGDKTGRSILHRWQWDETSPIFGNRAGGKFVGEAVPVDLDDGRTLYLTLTSQKGSGGMTYGQSVPWNRNAADKLTPAYKGWVSVPREDWPDVVIFGDERRPSSIRKVDVGDPSSLGKGYSVKSVMVRNSNEEPTRQIEKRLPWMSSLVGNMDGSRFTKTNEYAGSTASGAFIRKF